MSFGFKYGIPIDADIVMDVRFLPNPFYIPQLKPFTGLDRRVFDYVMSKKETKEFYAKFLDMLETAIPGYIGEGKEKIDYCNWLYRRTTQKCFNCASISSRLS